MSSDRIALTAAYPVKEAIVIAAINISIGLIPSLCVYSLTVSTLGILCRLNCLHNYDGCCEQLLCTNAHTVRKFRNDLH